jgi:hypothetical protein
MLSPTQNAKIHPAWRQARSAYEEDLDANIVVYSFPEFFTTEQIDSAAKTLRNWYPDEYEKVTGDKVAFEDSYKLRQRAFEESTKDSYMGVAAWGDWSETVPVGMVGVLLRHRVTSDEKYVLVPKDDYDARGTFQFVATGEELAWQGPRNG